MRYLKLYVSCVLAVLLVIGLSGCYNTLSIKAKPLKGPVAERVKNGEIQEPDDIVFNTGLRDNGLLEKQATVLIAEMSEEMMLSMMSMPFVAIHHGAAYDSVTGNSYSVQVMYLGKCSPTVEVDGKMAAMPCRQRLAVIIEGLDPAKSSGVKVVISDRHAERFFNLHGAPIPSSAFSREDYVDGKWDKIASVGTPVIERPMYDTKSFKAAVAGWMAYAITDPVTKESWNMLTPLQADPKDPSKRSEAETIRVVKEIARINEAYTAGQKLRAGLRGVAAGPNLISMGASLGLSAMSSLLIKSRDENLARDIVEGEDNGNGALHLVRRMMDESGSCQRPQVLVPVTREMAEALEKRRRQ